jgi:hypothetical protein
MANTPTKRAFTGRFGDPASFGFKGQFYRSITPICCEFSGHRISNVYTVHAMRSHRMGECCFPLFEKWNPKVYSRLLAAKLLQECVDESFKADVKVFNAKGDVNHRKSEWRKLRKRALKTVSEYQKATQDLWLPKPLFILKAEADKVPGTTPRWFDMHIPVLREKLDVKFPTV